MAAPQTHMLLPVTRAAVREVLTGECDPHRRQRELVRASLLACPDKPQAQRASRA